ncbi:MAG: ABC transporter ATP-binding protein [Sneathiella sp.]
MSNLIIKHLQHFNNRNFSVQIDHLEVEEGHIVCLLGPSGCGKSTTLRLAAGLENPDEGEIWINGDQVAGGHHFVGAEDRRVGLVFQDYALFPHLNVLDNVTFGLDHMTLADKKQTALHILEKLGLIMSARKFPHTLSGGEQQRVALARALAPNPKIILMDEPFSGLDVVLRNKVRDETVALLKETGTTVLLVTHDPEEAMRMADKIVLMKDGVIEQQGSPRELYSNPASEFVASFLGDVNRVDGMVRDEGVHTELGVVPYTGSAAKCSLLVRPEAIRLTEDQVPGKPTGKVVKSRNLGPFSLIDLELPSGLRVVARAASILQPADGQICSISLDLNQVFQFEH